MEGEIVRFLKNVLFTSFVKASGFTLQASSLTKGEIVRNFSMISLYSCILILIPSI